MKIAEINARTRTQALDIQRSSSNHLSHQHVHQFTQLFVRFLDAFFLESFKTHSINRFGPQAEATLPSLVNIGSISYLHQIEGKKPIDNQWEMSMKQSKPDMPR